RGGRLLRGFLLGRSDPDRAIGTAAAAVGGVPALRPRRSFHARGLRARVAVDGPGAVGLDGARGDIDRGAGARLAGGAAGGAAGGGHAAGAVAAVGVLPVLATHPAVVRVVGGRSEFVAAADRSGVGGRGRDRVV